MTISDIRRWIVLTNKSYKEWIKENNKYMAEQYFDKRKSYLDQFSKYYHNKQGEFTKEQQMFYDRNSKEYE
jgi:hypothetical protein